ncbi:unnamed protein product [Microthlaspi erraticum]|uniref:Uncharacterized protein n=1 Tax=Microthlaspi erraticum TaxID=1685480 RepID=A0A6D2K0I6_9BRAS|nr:unnamed protein product [Microthlaspi erraticum]
MVQADHDDYTIEGQNFGIRSNAEFNESVDKNEDLYGNNSFIMSRVQSKEDIEKISYDRGLLDSDSEWHDVMDEATQWSTPYQLRRLFVCLLIFCQVGSPLNLWNRYWKSLGEDMLHRKRKTFNFPKPTLNENQLKQYTLMEIEKLMNQGRSVAEFKDMPCYNR